MAVQRTKECCLICSNLCSRHVMGRVTFPDCVPCHRRCRQVAGCRGCWGRGSRWIPRWCRSAAHEARCDGQGKGTTKQEKQRTIYTWTWAKNDKQTKKFYLHCSFCSQVSMSMCANTVLLLEFCKSKSEGPPFPQNEKKGPHAPLHPNTNPPSPPKMAAIQSYRINKRKQNTCV